VFIIKLLLKVGLIVGGLAGVLLFLPGPDGEPMMSLESLPGYGLFSAAIDAEGFSDVAEGASEAIDGEPRSTEIYQWTDEDGTVHFTDKPMNGAKVHTIAAPNDPIPAGNFTGENFQKPRAEFKPKALKINDSRFSKKTSVANDDKSSVKPEDFDNLIDGDHRNIREIIDQLPDYLQDQHNKRLQPVN